MLATPSKYFQPSEMPSSDDLVFLGQVTPRRLVSPAMRRIHEQNMDSDPPSDDSNLSASPTHERVARRSGFKGSTPAPSLFSRSLSFSSGKPSSKILRSTIKRKSSSSLFGVDGETLSY